MFIISAVMPGFSRKYDWWRAEVWYQLSFAETAVEAVQGFRRKDRSPGGGPYCRAGFAGCPSP